MPLMVMTEKFQVEQNVDNTISFNFERIGADGTPAQLDQPVEVELLGINSFVTEQMSADPDARLCDHWHFA